MLPSAIIAGSSKCGSTSLFHWLGAHPDVCASHVKEVRFFMDDGYPLPRPREADLGLPGYETFFAHCPAGGCRVVLEATPDYLYQQSALAELPKLPSRPRLIFLLRKPSERIYSLYRFAMHNVSSVDQGTTFRQFLADIANPQHRIYRDIILRDALVQSEYFRWLEAWAAWFEPERIYIGLFEQMRADARGFTRGVCQFLDLDPTFYDTYEFPVLNESFVVRNQRLHRLRHRLVAAVPGLPQLTLAKKLYRMVNVSSGKQANGTTRGDEDVAELRRLDEHFAPWNARLAEKFNLDLSCWA
ncbi:MAG TPA: sulfotransferase domain-containing protein [Pirellulales bacterium]|jgi:hypothetical protein|nr:sulfotransferase domain-containing protein [Pirellulales bacterium]